MALKHKSTSPFFHRRCVRLCTILGMTGNREKKREAQINSKASRFQELCVCTHKHNEASRKISLRALTQATNKGFFPFFLLSNYPASFLRVELLLSLTHPEFFSFPRNVKRFSHRCRKVIRRVINLRIIFKAAQVTPASHYRIPFVGNLAENKQLWRLQSHVTQLEKVGNRNLGRLHYGRSFVINDGVEVGRKIGINRLEWFLLVLLGNLTDFY